MAELMVDGTWEAALSQKFSISLLPQAHVFSSKTCSASTSQLQPSSIIYGLMQYMYMSFERTGLYIVAYLFT